MSLAASGGSTNLKVILLFQRQPNSRQSSHHMLRPLIGQAHQCMVHIQSPVLLFAIHGPASRHFRGQISLEKTAICRTIVHHRPSLYPPARHLLPLSPARFRIILPPPYQQTLVPPRGSHSSIPIDPRLLDPQPTIPCTPPSREPIATTSLPANPTPDLAPM